LIEQDDSGIETVEDVPGKAGCAVAVGGVRGFPAAVLCGSASIADL